MKYKVELLPTAKKELASLPVEIRKRVYGRLVILSENPYPLGIKAIKGGNGIFRLRVGDYRIIYKVEKGRLLVLIIKIGHRKDIYR